MLCIEMDIIFVDFIFHWTVSKKMLRQLPNEKTNWVEVLNFPQVVQFALTAGEGLIRLMSSTGCNSFATNDIWSAPGLKTRMGVACK